MPKRQTEYEVDYSPQIFKILKAVFLNEPCNLYKIEKTTGLPHATVHKKVGEAYREGLIKIESEEKFRTGLTSRKYSLTPKGFGVLLRHHDKLFTDKDKQKVKKRLDELASRKPNFHPALEWWPIFRKGSNLVQQLFFAFLRGEDVFAATLLNIFSTWHEEKKFEHLGDGLHIGISLDFTQEQKKRLAEELSLLIKQEPKLRNFILSNLKWWKEYYKAGLEDITKIENALKSL